MFLVIKKLMEWKSHVCKQIEEIMTDTLKEIQIRLRSPETVIALHEESNCVRISN